MTLPAVSAAQAFGWTNPHFSPAFYCGAAMTHVYGVALEKRAQCIQYASTRFPTPALYPYALATPRYETR